MNNFISCLKQTIQICIKYQQRADINVQCVRYKNYTFRDLKPLKNI